VYVILISRSIPVVFIAYFQVWRGLSTCYCQPLQRRFLNDSRVILWCMGFPEFNWLIILTWPCPFEIHFHNIAEETQSLTSLCAIIFVLVMNTSEYRRTILKEKLNPKPSMYLQINFMQ
jgi:hypothetical protein